MDYMNQQSAMGLTDSHGETTPIKLKWPKLKEEEKRLKKEKEQLKKKKKQLHILVDKSFIKDKI